MKGAKAPFFFARPIASGGKLETGCPHQLAAPLQRYLPAALTDWMRPPVGDPLSGALLLARGAAPKERFCVGGEDAGQFRQDWKCSETPE